MYFMNEYLLILILAAVIIIFYLGYREYSTGTSPYRGRGCNGKAWKLAFPNAENESIRNFLECFVDGMGFSSKTKLKFHPNDQVIDVYRSLYLGKTPVGDNMECETFLENLSISFEIEMPKLTDQWYEQITLGELYELLPSNKFVSVV